MSKNIMVLSHRRSGTHLTIDAITNNFVGFDGKNSVVTLDHVCDNKKYPTDGEKKAFLVMISAGNYVIKSHSPSNWKEYFSSLNDEFIGLVGDIFNESKKVYVYRDGRDVMVSLYFYQKQFNKKTQEQSFSEFLHYPVAKEKTGYDIELSKPKMWANHVSGWLSANDVVAIRFDELKNSFDDTLNKLSVLIELPLRNDLLNTYMEKKAGGVEAKDKKNVSRSSVSFRGGRSGDWLQHLTDGDESYFTQEVISVDSNLLAVLS